MIDYLQKIKEDTELKALIPRGSAEEDKQLEDDISQNGLRKKLTLTHDYRLLDGYRRFPILKKLGIQPKFEFKIFGTKDYRKMTPTERKAYFDKIRLLEKEYVISINLIQRHLNNFQKIQLGIKLLDVESKLAKLRKLSNLTNSKISKASDDANEGKATAIVAKKIGVSTATFERGKLVLEKASPHIIEKVRKGSLSINSASKLVTMKERHNNKVEMPKGEFNVIYEDLPIQFNNRNIRGSADHHYKTMTVEELCKFKTPAAKNAVLFSWFSSAFILDGSADKILKSRGFNPKAIFVWVKDKLGTGSYNFNQHEFLIMAYKGNMPLPYKRFSSVIKAPREKHSKKPDIVYSMIEQMFPNGKYLEQFARQKRKGWASHGDEL